jgi:hypothetical protein
MTQPHRGIIGEAAAKVAADLLRTPSLPQQLGDHAAELIVGLNLAGLLACSSYGGATMSVDVNGHLKVPVEGAIFAAGCHVAA